MSQVKVKYGNDILAQNLKYLNSLNARVKNTQVKKVVTQKALKAKQPVIQKVLPVKYGNDVAKSNVLRTKALGTQKTVSKFKSQADKDIELEQAPAIDPRFTNLSNFDESELQSKQQQVAIELCKKIVGDNVQATILFGKIVNDINFFIQVSPQLIKYAEKNLKNPTADIISAQFEKLKAELQDLANTSRNSYNERSQKRVDEIERSIQQSQANAQSAVDAYEQGMNEKQRVKDYQKALYDEQQQKLADDIAATALKDAKNQRIRASIEASRENRKKAKESNKQRREQEAAQKRIARLEKMSQEQKLSEMEMEDYNANKLPGMSLEEHEAERRKIQVEKNLRALEALKQLQKAEDQYDANRADELKYLNEERRKAEEPRFYQEEKEDVEQKRNAFEELKKGQRAESLRNDIGNILEEADKKRNELKDKQIPSDLSQINLDDIRNMNQKDLVTFRDVLRQRYNKQDYPDLYTANVKSNSERQEQIIQFIQNETRNNESLSQRPIDSYYKTLTPTQSKAEFDKKLSSIGKKSVKAREKISTMPSKIDLEGEIEGTGFINTQQVYKHNIALLKGMKGRR